MHSEGALARRFDAFVPPRVVEGKVAPFNPNDPHCHASKEKLHLGIFSKRGHGFSKITWCQLRVLHSPL